MHFPGGALLPFLQSVKISSGVALLSFIPALSGLHPLGISGKSQTIPVYLLHIVNNTEQIPLHVYLFFTPQCETVKANSWCDMVKRRLTYCRPHPVKNSTWSRVNLPLHSLCKGNLAFCRPSHKISNLPYLCTLRIPQALGTKGTWKADRLGSLKLICPKVLHYNVGAAAVESFTCRA